MLTEEEKAKIRAEEIFRSEVRGESATKTTLSWWTVLNSSFALWFLSSVVIGGVTGYLSTSQSNRNEERRKAETQQRIATEISNRINQALAQLRSDDVQLKKGASYPPADIYNNVIQHLDNSASTADYSFYPEYRGRKFQLLIEDLRGVEPPTERPKLQRALKAFGQLDLLSWPAATPEKEPPDATQRQRAIEAVADATKLIKSELLGDYLNSSAFP